MKRKLPIEQRFFSACRRGDLEELTKLISPTVVNLVDPLNALTPLHQAVMYERAQTVEFLLKHGADPN